jgi:protein-S-isoprenylcysteine O-methyltransferase Ste14
MRAALCDGRVYRRRCRSSAARIGLYVLAITTFVLRNEERVLRSKFGAAFETYCSRTPRWIFI